MAKLYKCPVCDGKGIVPAGFYLSATDIITVGSTAPETCKSCNGAGILWDYTGLPEYEVQQVTSPNYTYLIEGAI